MCLYYVFSCHGTSERSGDSSAVCLSSGGRPVQTAAHGLGRRGPRADRAERTCPGTGHEAPDEQWV